MGASDWRCDSSGNALVTLGFSPAAAMMMRGRAAKGYAKHYWTKQIFRNIQRRVIDLLLA